jgi:hypothetical protein
MLPQQIMKSSNFSPKSRFSMVSLSSLILSSIFSVVAKLTGEFTLLEEPTMILILPMSRFSCRRI